MNRSLRIAVADDEPRMREYFQKILPRLGHEVVAAAATGSELVEQCRAQRPDLIITDINMPEMDGIEATNLIYSDEPVPVILVSAHHDEALVLRAETAHIMSYLIKPIKQADLVPAITIAMKRFEEAQVLRDETASLKQSLEERKVIEKAKGVLMRVAGLDENEAHRRLQKLACDSRKKVIDVARTILATEEAAVIPRVK